MSPERICILCNKPSEESQRVSNSEIYYLRCKICGRYRSGSFIDETTFRTMASDKKAMISAYTRELYELNAPMPELHTLDNENQIDVITERYEKKTIIEKLNNLILYVGRKSRYFGEPLHVHGENDYPITYSVSIVEFENIRNQAYAAKYFLLPVSGGNVTLTWEGWKKFEEMKEAGTISRKCFVAMSCSSELANIYENGIKIAVEEAGYMPIFIEREEHNEKICDLIIAEIRSSKFLIADITGQRQNVYYEAGFAHGLNKDIIWTCRQDEINNAHFDTRQYNHIVWQSASDLKIKLVNRIKATII